MGIIVYIFILLICVGPRISLCIVIFRLGQLIYAIIKKKDMNVIKKIIIHLIISIILCAILYGLLVYSMSRPGAFFDADGLRSAG